MIAALLLLLASVASAADFAVARPGYRFEFPRDHFAHPEFQTEWWYWTGNLRDPSGRRFGFELTFFRQAVAKGPASGPWELRDLYLAHLTLSDITGRRFLHEERLNRAGPSLAGADVARGLIWNGNWRAGLNRLEAVTETFRLDLRLRSNKPPVIHGVDGVSQKAAGEGRASHYVSFTRLLASGSLELEGQRYQLEGTAWMDHEFFTHQLTEDQVGWDWMSIQLDNGTELMLFRLRRRDGSVDPYSAGTFVDASGKSRHLSAAEFRIEPVPGSEWRLYPLKWKVHVPSLGIALEASTRLQNQEVTSKNRVSPNYWEGAMDFTGSTHGVGYLEMTGYDRPIRLDK